MINAKGYRFRWVLQWRSAAKIFQEEGDELPEGSIDLNADHIYSILVHFSLAN